MILSFPMNDYYKNLPRKWMGAGALFFNAEGKVLIVKPTYKKDFWEIPGGSVDENESPWVCCQREVREELGLDISAKKLLSVDYISNHDERGDRLMFIFDGGVLPPSEISRIVLQEKELCEYRFVDVAEAKELLGTKLKRRVPNSIQAQNEGTMIYLENGEPIQ